MSIRQNIRRFLFYGSLLALVVGLAMTAGFFARRYKERQTQLRVMAAFEEKIASAHQLDNDHAYTGSMSTSHIDIPDGDTIAILELERLGIKVSIAQGIDKDVLHISAGHFPGTAMPGQGNFAIAGHSSMVYTCLFNDLHKAVVGDKIIVTTRTGRHKYLISEIKVVSPTDTELLNPTRESIISIITCTNKGRERLLLKGIEIHD